MANKIIAETCIDIENVNDRMKVISTIKTVAKSLNMSILNQTQLLTAVVEIVMNIINHAGKGQVYINAESKNRRKKIIINAIDKGPGITDLEAAMTRGFSSKKSLGLGLPGAKKLSDEFHITSKIGEGTDVTIIKWV